MFGSTAELLAKKIMNYYIIKLICFMNMQLIIIVFVNLKLCHFQWKFQLKMAQFFYYAPSVMVTQKEVERR